MPTDLLLVASAAYLGATAGTLTNFALHRFQRPPSQRRRSYPRRTNWRTPASPDEPVHGQMRKASRRWARAQDADGLAPFAEGYVRDALDDGLFDDWRSR